MYKSINNIRQEFLNFFQKKEHQIIPSSSLIPDNDQTLLFTNSGMNQFKNIFLGTETTSLKRVVTAQRCMRAGGKHNDLDNVGYTERHLTFFEMLGNFSFGDYFKSDAIQFAWELLTDIHWFNLSPDKILVTTHNCDDESYNIWKKDIGISNNRIIKIGSKNDDFYDSTNFWKMGNYGPCGPCSEIFYDLGDNFSGEMSGNIQNHGERYIEIWNLVFMQFNRQENGNMTVLPLLSVDTGMGLERITAILQGVHSNYLIDAFKSLIISISQIMKITNSINRSLYVIADHLRACAFLIQDGIIPSNEGRGYVLRRIIRRAIGHGRKLGVRDMFLYKLVTPLIQNMNHITRILYDQKDSIEQILFNEEKLFQNTLKRGLELLEQELLKLKGNNILDGKTIFKLYTTYGFPLELTKDICYTRNIRVDQLEFNQLMLKEKKFSQKTNKFYKNSNNILPYNVISKFIGYQTFSCQSKITALCQDNNLVNIIHPNKTSEVILDITPFYGESGGQIGDCGYLKTESSMFKVINTKKYKQTIVHKGIIIYGHMSLGERVFAQIDSLQRKQVSLNHSATHLLHAALLKILGSHVIQRGSLVSDKYLRFDFSHYTCMTELQLNAVENLVNQQIWSNLVIASNIMSIESALSVGAKMLLDKQYNQEVRVLQIGNFSIELCGGTHAEYTGEIGLFIITKELGIGSGVRRIEAVTKDIGLSMIQHKKTLIQNIIHIMKSDNTNLLNKIYEFKCRYGKLQKEIKYLKNEQELQKGLLLIRDMQCIKDVHVLIKDFKNTNLKTLFNIIKNLNNHIKSGIIILVNYKNNTKINLIISITKNLVQCNRINALDLVNFIIQSFGGKGGGKSNFAQVSINNLKVKPKLMEKINTLLNNLL